MRNGRNKNQINTVLIEDEKKSLLTLQSLLQKYCPDVVMVGSASNVAEALQIIPSVQPDLIFLDISMPDGDAFDLLNELETIDFEIVFVTAYNEFALKAFDFSALHYLLKPINHLDLIEAVNRYLRTRADLKITERINILNQSLQNNYVKISIPTIDGLIILEIDNIIRIEAASNYCKFFLNDNTSVMASKPLSHFENILTELHFTRIHNTHMINLKYVIKYQKGRGGLVSMADGSQVNVSASHKNEFLEQLNQVSVRLK